MASDEYVALVIIAYLNSEYPSRSHTFIEREVRAIRHRGVEVKTFSVRPAAQSGRTGTANQQAAAATTVIQSGAGTLARDFLLGAIQSPLGVVRALLASQRLSPAGVGSRLRHAAYVVEGVRLARLLSRSGIKHVHVHMANNGAAIAMMACAFDRSLRYSLSIHGSAEFFNVDTGTLTEKVESAVFVRCISEFCRAQVMYWTDPSHWDRFHIVRCGVDLPAYGARPQGRSGPLRMLTVGRLHPIKGYDVLLKACARLKRDGVAFELEMIGDGPMRDRLETLVRSLQLADSVRLIGAVDQDRIGKFFDAADIMIVSSFMEGVPVVLMEAMAKELGVVATRVGGIPELVNDGITGFLVDPGSTDALADAIRTYAENTPLSREHGSRGRKRVVTEYDATTTGTAMIALFDRYVQDGGPLPRCSRS